MCQVLHWFLTVEIFALSYHVEKFAQGGRSLSQAELHCEANSWVEAVSACLAGR